MANGGKDIKLGHDKRPVSVVPSEELLYNIFNGEVLTDALVNHYLLMSKLYSSMMLSLNHRHQ